MALDQSALLDRLGQLQQTDVTDRVRSATERISSYLQSRPMDSMGQNFGLSRRAHSIELVCGHRCGPFSDPARGVRAAVDAARQALSSAIIQR